MAFGGSGGGGRRRRMGGMNDINVTPLIDVMLVLLVIFMVTAPLLTTGVQVDLPKVKSAPMQTDDSSGSSAFSTAFPGKAPTSPG